MRARGGCRLVSAVRVEPAIGGAGGGPVGEGPDGGVLRGGEGGRRLRRQRRSTLPGFYLLIIPASPRSPSDFRSAPHPHTPRARTHTHSRHTYADTHRHMHTHAQASTHAIHAHTRTPAPTHARPPPHPHIHTHAPPPHTHTQALSSWKAAAAPSRLRGNVPIYLGLFSPRFFADPNIRGAQSLVTPPVHRKQRPSSWLLAVFIGC